MQSRVDHASLRKRQNEIKTIARERNTGQY